MNTKNLIPVALLTLFLATAAVGQAPLLQVSAATEVAHGWRVLLTNNYTSAVTAYALRTPGGAVKWEDSIPGDLGLRPQLSPHGTGSVFVPGGSSNPAIVENTAVIYADGTSAGDPSVVAEFLHIRTLFLAEIPGAIARLEAAAADPGATRSLLVGEFHQQAQSNLPALRNGMAGPVSDRVSDDVAATLADPNNRDLQETAGSLAATLTRWRQQLKQSLPRLQTASPPTP